MNPPELVLPVPAGGDAATSVRSGVLSLARIESPIAFALAGLSGVAYSTAFPPLSWPIAAWFALAPLMIACAALPPRRAAMAGMFWTAIAGVGVTWFLPGMLSRYFGLSLVAAWLATVAILGVHGLAVSAYAAWIAWLARRRAANPLLLAAGWLVCEYGRAGVSGLPWALVAYSQMRWTAVIQIADLAGPYGIGMLVAAVNAGAAALAMPALRGRRPVLAATTIAAALAGALVYGRWQLAESFADGPPVAVAVVQAGASPVEHAERATRLARYLALTSAANGRARLIVWPEYATEAYLDEDSPTRDAILRAASDARADLVVGGPHWEPSATGARYHNSVYLVRAGHVAARYDKHRLVPFAEDDQVVRAFGRTPSGYTRGRGGFVLPATDLRLGVSLCLEAMFPPLARAAVAEGAEVLVTLSNDDWFGHVEPARQQLDIAALRAVETRRHLVRAAATGISAVIDPHGRTLAETGFDVDRMLASTVRASHARTPYERWGDAFAWVVIAGVALATLSRCSIAA